MIKDFGKFFWEIFLGYQRAIFSESLSDLQKIMGSGTSDCAPTSAQINLV
jgi:hypothetical protein